MSVDVANIIEELDPEPDPLVSEEQSNRFEHLDLASETPESLKRELAWLRVRNHLVYSEWHVLREEAVSDAISRIRDRQRDAHRIQR